MAEYNGWTNYATWRVNLEIFDGLNPSEMGWHKLDKFDLADCLKEYVQEILGEGCRNEGLVFDYALAFISCVNWREIAGHMLEEYAEEEA